MVYIHFPAELTEEELMLKNKFQQLRKKKKALEEMNKPKPQPNTSPVINHRRPKETARDTREKVQKLLKSGVIGPIVKISNHTDKESFKKPCGMEHKTLAMSETLTSYQPFSAPSLVTTKVSDSKPNPNVETGTSNYKNLYSNFVPATMKTTAPAQSSLENSKCAKPVPKTIRKGLTIFVEGTTTLTEEFLRTAFKKFGEIINISLEVEKNRGFITFDSTDNADKAVARMHTRTICGIKLKVSISRNQPIEHDDKGFSTQSAITTTTSENKQSEDRSLVTYSDVFS